MKQMSKRRKQGGFILGYVLLGVLLISVVIAAIARANSGPSPQANAESNKMYAATVIKIGNDLRDGAIRYSSDRDINSMTLDTTSGTGLYDPALALANEVKVPSKATTAGAGDVAFALDKTNITVTSMGSSAAEVAVEASGLTAGVCAAINNVLYGDSVTTAIPTTVGIRQEGCAALTTPAGNTYYKVVQPG